MKKSRKSASVLLSSPTFSERYVLSPNVIEGQASMNSEKWSQFNYELSFRRALALVDFWSKDCKIQFSKNCEIQIAGSGDGRLNVDPMRDKTEKNNQRFLIHIVPKNIITEN